MILRYFSIAIRLLLVLIFVVTGRFGADQSQAQNMPPAARPTAASPATWAGFNRRAVSRVTPPQARKAVLSTDERGQKTVTDAAGRSHVRPARITPTERQAAASRMKAVRFAASRKNTKVSRSISPLSKTLSYSTLAMNMTAMTAAAPDYFGVPNYANSPLPRRSCSDAAQTACFGDMDCASLPDAVDPNAPAVCSGPVTSGGIRKFVDSLAGLGAANANNLGQYIPVAVPDTTTYPGSDYYEIALVEYSEQMHSDLPATKLRGYVQLETQTNSAQSNHFQLSGGYLGLDKPHYLGPMIIAKRDKPVRILFRNLLPTGAGGNLFLPVDTTVMGSGMGPDMAGMSEPDPQNPMCGMPGEKSMGCYTENRGTLHLHGGITPWISDGTPHQWITPAGENTSYPKGVSVKNVPDMPDPGAGAMTFFYTNQQSARLMFYHDHSWGITRLNVYAGEAAGYLIEDDTEKALLDKGLLPKDQLPLIIQDKTFVPSAAQLATTDPLWDMNRWGGFGGLWVPHVYVPAQNPGDSSGVNAYGRWAYGPWFWPPTTGVANGPIDNPYYDPNCNPQGLEGIWCQPEKMPGTPFVSMGMEAFNDTPLVNGTVYPTVTLEPKAYRLRILNAANDRFFNLQLYKADASGKEVALNQAELAAAQSDPIVFPTPDTTVSTPGPNWIQIGTEGGFLPAPVEVPQQPITWVTDPTVFNAGNVDKHSLLLGPAERADVLIDLTNYADQTLILYNDAPAAFPARDPRYDYYTGGPDMTATGGAPATQPGYGPNTRTIMQIKVAGSCTTNCSTVNLTGLQAEFAHHLDESSNPAGVFEKSQNPIVVGQGAYNSAYGSAFRYVAPRDGFARISDTQLTFNTLLGQGAAQTLTIPLQPKAIQDEMGEAFDHDYGRMSGNLGLEAPNANALAQNLILYPYVNPSTENLTGMFSAAPISSSADGTQLWKITHNGVDTHPIHFHLFDIQLVNRVGWDGIIRKPEASELGWKDTVRVSPLEDTIVALRPIIPKIPFGIPESIRPLNPMMPLGSTAMFVNTDANANPINSPIENKEVNFGWEYVWHCHILSHEEMDMMRPISVNVPSLLPASPSVGYTLDNSGVNLTWTDGTPVDYANIFTWGSPASEIGYRVERAPVDNGQVGDYTEIGTTLANVTAFSDASNPNGSNAYSYRVIAYNAAGDSPSIAVSTIPPKAEIAPASLAFNGQLINTTSAIQTVTLTNAGGGSLTIAGIALTGTNASDFAQSNTCGASLGEGANCTITVTFRPTTTGAKAASLVVSTNDPVNPQVSVALSGPGGEIRLSNAVGNFGRVAVGSTSSAFGVTIYNNFPAPLNITAMTAPAGFTVTQNCVKSIPSFGSCSFSMTFVPTVEGYQVGNVVITSDAPAGAPTTIELRGTGVVATGTVTLSNTSGNFGYVAVGTVSNPFGVTIYNNQSVPLNISSMTAPAGFTVGQTCVKTIPALGSCSFTMNFAPTALGSVQGNVVITSNAPAGSPSTILLKGTGVSATPYVSLSNTVGNFGYVPVGSTSSLFGVTINNQQAVPLKISAITAPTSFTASQNCVTTIPAYGKCSFTMAFVPTAIGYVQGNVLITWDAPAGSPSTILLKGTGVSATPTVTLSNTVGNFGNVAVGTTSNAFGVTIANLQPVPLNITAMTAPANFTVTQNCVKTIPAYGSCSFSMTFVPTAVGYVQGNMVITSNAPAGSPSTILLKGTGVAP